MGNKKKQMYYVKREVLARDIISAAKAPGRIYEISLAQEKDQPIDEIRMKGFAPEKKII